VKASLTKPTKETFTGKELDEETGATTSGQDITMRHWGAGRS